MRFHGALIALVAAAGLVGASGAVAVGPARAASQPAASDQYKQLLTGRWQAQVDDPSGSPITMTLTLNADGTYARVFTSASGEPPPPATNGTWTVQTIGDGKFSLTLVRAGQPASGAMAVVWRVVDNDTLFNETENYRARRVR